MSVARAQPIEQYASPAFGINATLIDDTTARTILAAVVGKSYYITQIKALNATAGENPVILVKDGTLTLAALQPGALADVGAGDYQEFNPPLETTAGAAVTGEATTAIGDTRVQINGYLGD